MEDTSRARNYKFWTSPEQLEKIAKMRKRGATIARIAQHIGITRKTLHEWMKINVSLRDIIKESVEEATDEVENALFKSACGYHIKEDKAFFDKDTRKVVKEKVSVYVPPNTAAQIFWLKNRRGDDWKEKVENQTVIQLEDITPISQMIKETMKEEQQKKLVDPENNEEEEIDLTDGMYKDNDD